MIYCLDANTLIEAKNLHYSMDFCPAFWEMVKNENSKGQIFSIDFIAKELARGNDELADWAKRNKKIFIETSDIETQMVYIEIVNDVNENYSEVEARKFLDVADPWLIAKCKTMDATLVTKEVFARGAKKVKIPNICEKFGVKYMQTHEMIRALGVKFIL
jgi:hypothetical protein